WTDQTQNLYFYTQHLPVDLRQTVQAQREQRCSTVTPFPPTYSSHLILLLNCWQSKLLAHVVAQHLPPAKVGILVPRQEADPRLHVVVHAQHHVVLLGNLARRVRDLVLGALVLDGELAAIFVVRFSSFSF